MSMSELGKANNPIELPVGALGRDDATKILNRNDGEAKSKHRWQMAFFVAVCCIVLIMLLGPGLVPPKVDNLHYVYLAQNMVQGRLSVDDIPASIFGRRDLERPQISAPGSTACCCAYSFSCRYCNWGCISCGSATC